MENCITVGEMIAETKELNRGAYSDSQLMKWLSDVDARLYQEVICTHVGSIWRTLCSFLRHGVRYIGIGWMQKSILLAVRPTDTIMQQRSIIQHYQIIQTGIIEHIAPYIKPI